MRSRALAAALCAAGTLAVAAPASAATHEVHALFAEFSPTPLDVLPGETVEWMNMSERRHTVTADDGSFESGDQFNPGASFSQTFDSVGTYLYHCRLHAGMVGEIDVRRVTLDALPTAPVPQGDALALSGRTATPVQPVTIELDSGHGFAPVGTATPSADGNWKATVKAQHTGDYRAVVGADASESRRVVVSDRKITIRVTRTGVAVSVRPALPYARVVLQQYLRERFGWWPQKRGRLDYVSTASFRVSRPARVRVALPGSDGWTPLVTSKVVTLTRRASGSRASRSRRSADPRATATAPRAR